MDQGLLLGVCRFALGRRVWFLLFLFFVWLVCFFIFSLTVRLRGEVEFFVQIFEFFFDFFKVFRSKKLFIFKDVEEFFFIKLEDFFEHFFFFGFLINFLVLIILLRDFSFLCILVLLPLFSDVEGLVFISLILLLLLGLLLSQPMPSPANLDSLEVILVSIIAKVKFYLIATSGALDVLFKPSPQAVQMENVTTFQFLSLLDFL